MKPLLQVSRQEEEMLAKDEELEQVKQRQLEAQQLLQSFESKQQQVCDMSTRTTHSYCSGLQTRRGRH